MIRMENSKSVMAAVESYKAEMSRLGLPQEMAALNEANRRAHAPATVNSQKNEDYSDKMNKELKEFFDSIVKRNQSVSQEMCTQLLGNLYQAIGDKVSSGIFTRPGRSSGVQGGGGEDGAALQWRPRPRKGSWRSCFSASLQEGEGLLINNSNPKS